MMPYLVGEWRLQRAEATLSTLTLVRETIKNEGKLLRGLL